jgi:hypothetical protein
MKIEKASSSNSKIRIANCGESNSGKTYTALLMAKYLNGGSMDGVVLIDTENRGELYEHYFSGYGIIKVDYPFDPEKLVDALKLCEKAKIVIVDSGSDFWERTNQIHKEVSATMKNTYYAWGKVTPRWDALRAAINNAPFHVITCWRMKEKLVKQGQEMVSDGQKVVARGGAKGILFDYTLAFTINDKHLATVRKDNLHLFADWKEPKMVDEKIALRIKQWLDRKPTKQGEEKNERSKQSNSNRPVGERPRA